MPLIGCVASVVSNAYTITQNVYDRVQTLSANDEFRRRIEKVIKELQQIANQLKASGIEDLPATCNEFIEKIENSLGSCKATIEVLESKGRFAQLVQAPAHKHKLEILERDLDNARSNLQLVLTTALLAQNKSTEQTVINEGAAIRATVIHPTVGVYKGTKSSNKHARPRRIERPEIKVGEDMMTIKWYDSENIIDDLDRYEVRYDDQNEMILPGVPHELMLPGTEERTPSFTLSLSPPRIEAGKVYTVQVRAVNSEGPGEWSDQRICRFKSGIPNKPRKPTLSIANPTEVVLETDRLSEDDENGSFVINCVVEYLSITDSDNVSNWQRLVCPITRRERKIVKTSIKGLIPDTVYRFRVRMINGVGESPPSDTADIKTTQMIPGVPQEVRVSSKRTDTSIKIRWKKPKINPQAAVKYQLQYQLVKTKTVEEWHSCESTGKLSGTVQGLETDTVYRFRVRAINNKADHGEFSDAVVAETRYGKFGRALASTGAFFGGTVGGPLVGATSMGYLAGSSASNVPDSKAGKKAAGAAAGIGGGIGGALLGTIGAPILGAAAAVMAYKHLSGEMGDISPQSSEDEEEESMFREVWKITKKKTDKMMSNDKQ